MLYIYLDLRLAFLLDIYYLKQRTSNLVEFILLSFIGTQNIPANLNQQHCSILTYKSVVYVSRSSAGR